MSHQPRQQSNLKYIKTIKNLLPDVLTVIGGPHPTFLPLDTLKGLKELNIVVIGEGEETIVNLAEKYEKRTKKDWKTLEESHAVKDPG